MPFEAISLTVQERVDILRSNYRHHAAIPVLMQALKDPLLGRTALVSSFGAESVVLLDIVANIAPETPVLFLNSELMFPETLAYQQQVTQYLGLKDVRVVAPNSADVAEADPDKNLHSNDPDACCNIRKVNTLHSALKGFDTWITGRKRFQSGQRVDLPLFEQDGDRRIKINPLAHWRREDVIAYIEENNLPKHPLVAQGYASIGCAPCTQTTAATDNPRDGRWAGQDKTECGIHFPRSEK